MVSRKSLCLTPNRCQHFRFLLRVFRSGKWKTWTKTLFTAQHDHSDFLFSPLDSHVPPSCPIVAIAAADAAHHPMMHTRVSSNVSWLPFLRFCPFSATRYTTIAHVVIQLRPTYSTNTRQRVSVGALTNAKTSNTSAVAATTPSDPATTVTDTSAFASPAAAVANTCDTTTTATATESNAGQQ